MFCEAKYGRQQSCRQKDGLSLSERHRKSKIFDGFFFRDLLGQLCWKQDKRYSALLKANQIICKKDIFFFKCLYNVGERRPSTIVDMCSACRTHLTHKYPFFLIKCYEIGSERSPPPPPFDSVSACLFPFDSSTAKPGFHLFVFFIKSLIGCRLFFWFDLSNQRFEVKSKAFDGLQRSCKQRYSPF